MWPRQGTPRYSLRLKKKNVRPNRPSSTTFNRRRGRPRIPERPKADCTGLLRTWMHEQNGLSTRRGLLQAAVCQCPRQCAREGCFQQFSEIGQPSVFNHFQGSANPAMRAHVIGCLLGNRLGMGCQNTLRIIGCKSPVVGTGPSIVQRRHRSVSTDVSKHFSCTFSPAVHACDVAWRASPRPGPDARLQRPQICNPLPLPSVPHSCSHVLCGTYIFGSVTYTVTSPRVTLPFTRSPMSPHSTTAARNCPHAYFVAPSQYFVFCKRRLPGRGFICTRLCSRVFAIVTASCAVSNRESR